MASRSSRVTRRRFVAPTMGAAVSVGASLSRTVAHASQTALVASGQSSGGQGVDQNPIRRRGVGLRGLDSARACHGLTLFAPIGGARAVHLIDLHGSVVHTWKTPYPPGLYGYITDRGTLFYNGKIPNDTFLGILQSPHFQRAASAEREHVDQRRRFRTVLRGDARG